MIEQSPLAILRVSVADMVHLRVRARRLKEDAPPEFLYQGLPPEAMSVMGTIPRGSFAVSIPHRNIPGCGYEIVQTPPSGDGFVIVYARRPNNRYEAVGVLFRDETLSIEDFHEQARQWIRRKIGRLKTAPDCYAYFALAREQWAVILRDNGYTVSDPSKLPNAITRELRDALKNEPGTILARVPVYAGKKQPQSSTLPVFSQVELSSGPRPESEDFWISFVEYQKTRAFRSQPPPGIVPDFAEWLQLLTTESGFERWVFRPGMFFGDRIEWWGDRNRRRTEHEGLDFVEGLHADETIRSISESTPVCAMADGDAVAVLDDFLGKTVVLRHPSITHESGDIFYTFLSHIRPVSKKLGFVSKGRLIGRVGRSEGSIAPAHFHLSGAWIPHSIDPGTITLDHIHPANASVTLVNFNELIKSSPLCISNTSGDA